MDGRLLAWTVAHPEAEFSSYGVNVADDIRMLLAAVLVDGPPKKSPKSARKQHDRKHSSTAARPSAGLARTLERTVVTSFGTDFATASTLFMRDATPGSVGRQMQIWARLPEGWRIVAAHVSLTPTIGPG